MNPMQFTPWPGDAADVVVLRAEIPRDLFVECVLELHSAHTWVLKMTLLHCPDWTAQWDALEACCPEILVWSQEYGFEDFMHRMDLPTRKLFSDLPLISKLIAAHAVETRPL